MIKIERPKRERFAALSQRPVVDSNELDIAVKEILTAVKSRGDEALYKYTERFDKVRLESLLVADQVVNLSPDLRRAIDIAAKNITTFHAAQLGNASGKQSLAVDTQPGVKCWRRSVPTSPVGLYIPAGSAPLFSTVLMLAIPARLAGCKEVILCSAPDNTGRIAPEVYYCAKMLGVEKIFSVGGAQAIAAMAYGTESIPAVAKIFGPGNQYVTAAKRLIAGDGVGIDMLAGPSELAVIADSTADPAFVAADLLSQAEHGADSQVILITDSQKLIEQVLQELEVQLKYLPRSNIARECLSCSKALLFDELEEGIEFSNYYAPEHLIIATKDSQQLALKVVNAGSVFIGNFTPESAGDYASGTNHVLPTLRNARHIGGVSLASFLKEITFQEITEEGLAELGPTIMKMAKAEQLEAHSRAVEIRLERGRDV